MNPAIENYQRLSSLAAQMRVAATQGEWDHLVELEKQCGLQVEVIRTLDATVPLNESALLLKTELIRKILADHAEVRKHTEPWMSQLQHNMQSAEQEHRLHQAYSGEY